MLVKLIRKWRMVWAVFTVVLNFAAILMVLFVFPDVSNLWVAVFVLASGFTSSLTALGDMLVNAEESEKNDSE